MLGGAIRNIICMMTKWINFKKNEERGEGEADQSENGERGKKQGGKGSGGEFFDADESANRCPGGERKT